MELLESAASSSLEKIFFYKLMLFENDEINIGYCFIICIKLS